ncbi:MAG: hypothetical protein J7L32_04415, partial [Thermoplasmata archaeon]|nr:hypothetical protein [Thermoplasmata archaeon]
MSGRRLSEEENALRLELYRKGYSDREIADEVGVTPVVILSWRKKNNLKPNIQQGQPLSDAEEKRRLELYKKGLNDKQIASVIGISEEGIWQWRKKRGLVANIPQDNKKVSPEENKYRMMLYRQGLSDKEIAEKCSVSRSSIKGWRKYRGLKPNKKKGGQTIKLNFEYNWRLGYFVGLINGDGYIHKCGRSYRIKVQSPRKEYIDLVEKQMRILFPELSVTRFKYLNTGKGYSKEEKIYYVVNLTSKVLYEFVSKFKKRDGIWNIPYNYPEDFQYGFIGGLIDSDGTVTKYSFSVYN